MSNRILSVNQLIKEELSRIIFREVDFLPGKVMITLTRVETFANLSQSKIYISCIPEDKIGKVVQVLNKQVFKLQQELNHRLKMRPIPKIFFVSEKETATAGRVEEILERLKKEKK